MSKQLHTPEFRAMVAKCVLNFLQKEKCLLMNM